MAIPKTGLLGKESNSASGLNDFTLTGAKTDFRTILAAVGGTGGVEVYYIARNGAEVEEGIGTLSSGGGSLTRDTVLRSSNSDAKVDFSSAPDVYVGSISKYFGAITPWASHTPTGTAWINGNVSAAGYYRRVGAMLEVRVKLTLSGTPGNAALRLDPPSGFTVDSNLADLMPLGQAHLEDLGTAARPGAVDWDNTNGQVKVRSYEGNGSGNPLTFRAVNQTTPHAWGSGDSASVFYRLPVE